MHIDPEELTAITQIIFALAALITAMRTSRERKTRD